MRVYGPEGAPEIVFVHGIAQSQLAFQHQVESELAQRYRLVTYDLRGHGESDKPLDPSAYASGRVMSDDLQTNIRATAEFVAACVAEPLSAEDFALMLGYNMASPVHARAATLKWSGSTDFAQALAALRLPVLVTHGRQDQVIAPAVAEQAILDMPQAQLSWYDAAGHSPFFEDPERFNRELAAFVDAAASKP